MENVKKVLLAVGFRQLEEFLQKKLKNEFKFVGVTVYREGVIRSIGQTDPDVVIIRETLEGKENILSIIYEIRNKFPRVRVIFIGGKREPGDPLLSTLASYGVWDILYGEKIQAQDVIGLLREPNEYKDVQHLQPKPVFDERKNKVGFEAPDAVTIEKEVVKEVYIDGGTKEEIKPPKKRGEAPIPPPQTQPEPQPDPNPAPVEPEQPPQKLVILKGEEPADPKPEVEQDPKPEPKKPETQNGEKTSGKQKSKPDEAKDKGGIFNKLFGGKDDSRSTQEIVNGKQKIITFMGAKPGLGNTSLALNTAVTLAQRNQKVIFIEVSDRTPSVNYWYELGHLDHGIDTALKGLEENRFEKVKQAIIHSEQLAKSESNLQKNYKRFPKKLDFMFFSNRYLTRNNEEDDLTLDMSLTKELYLYLLFQMEYDFIVIDVSPHLENPATMNALVYSNKTFITVTQDVSAIGSSVYLLNELSKRGIQMANKVQYIVNRYEKAELDLEEISEWIQVNDMLTVPCSNKEFIDANFVGLPIVLYSKNTHIKNVFQKIEKKIL